MENSESRFKKVIVMQMAKAARGRPKGTGLDDAAMLAELKTLIARTPGMKPTTAIKALGVSNPSIIRRLRDKLAAADAGTFVPVASEKPRAVALGTTAEPRRTGSVRKAAATPVVEAAVTTAIQETPSLPSIANPVVAAWLSLGLEMWMASARLQFTLVEQVLRLPELNPVLRHHAALRSGTASHKATSAAEAPRLH